MKKRVSKLIRNEKGQALVIVLCFLTIGGLTIAPLLHHMYTGLTSGQIHGERMPLTYAADAGMEDGIWKTDNEDMQLEPYNLALYDYDDEYNYSLPEEINDNTVDISIKQIWPLDGLESDANGTVPATGLLITGGVISTEGEFQIRISYDTPEELLEIDRIAVWLPPDFEYVADSSSGITTDNPAEFDWNGGKVLKWDFLPAVDFADLPEPGQGDPLEGGFQPAAERPSIRILEFNVTPLGKVACGSFSWVRTEDPSHYLSWESSVTIYKINSTATDSTTGKQITAEGYTYVSKGVDTGWLDTGGMLFTGNYRAIGNTLMENNDGDRSREILLSESSATISDIPGHSEVSFAYLYWSGWRNWGGSMVADTTCTFKIEGVEILIPNASGDYTECAPVGDVTNYLCVDEAVADEDLTFVRTGHEFQILRPNAAGTYTQCDTVGDFPNYECVDEVAVDEDYTYVRTWYGGTELDTYNLEDAQPSGRITSVVVYVRARATSGGHAADTVIRTHDTDYFGTYTSMPTSYTYLSTTYTTNPYTGLAWTWDEIGDLEAGVRHHDLNGGYLRTTQVYVGVEYDESELLTVILRPNAAGDETNITYQEPSSGAHYTKVSEEAADDFSTYVYTSDTPTLPSDWYNTDWQYRKKITIDYNKVEADLTDFPVLISITASDLRDHAKSDGSDIVFTSSDGIIKLKREIESYDNSSGTLVAWVKTDLSSTSDTEIYIYYGNSAASETNDTDTWDTNFKLVTHMRDDPDNAHTKDSTTNNNDGTKVAANQPIVTTDGKIDDAQDFDGGNDEVDHQNPSSLQITDNLTISAWAKPDVTGSYMGIAGKLVHSGGNYTGYALVKHNTNYFHFFTASAGEPDYVESNSAYADTNWHYVVGTRVGGTNYLYVDGALQTDTGTQSLSDSGDDFIVGRQYRDYNDRWWNGVVDEVRVSNIARSAGWIETSYNNQSAPGNFYSVGIEELTIGGYERDLYSVPGYGSGMSITKVTVYFRFSGDQVGVDDYTGYARAAIKTNGTVYLGSVESQMGKTFVTKSYTWTTNPYTGSPWIWSEIAGLQIGIELAGTTTTQAYCTQVYIGVEYGLPSGQEEIDTYNIEDHSKGSGNINSVTVHIKTRGTALADTHAAETVIRTHDTNYTDNYTLLPLSYTTLSTTYTINPYTGLAWTWDEIDALQAGVKHYDEGLGSAYTTQVYIDVRYGMVTEEEITADTWWLVENASPDYSYSCFKDVTDLVASITDGNATYTVGGVDGDTWTEWSYAGWSLIIIYASPYEEGHQFYLWDLLMFAGTNATGSFIIEGFQAPADAEATLTCFVAEGDDWYDNDSLQFNGSYMTDEINPYDDVWNGKCSALGGAIIDGVDIDTFDVSSPIIAPGDTSAEVTFTTAQDSWNLIYLILAFRSDLAVLTPSSTGIFSYGF